MGVKLKQFKYILLPIIPISIAKVVLFFFIAQEITQLPLDYHQYLEFSDSPLSQLEKNNADHLSLIFNYSYLDSSQSLKALCEKISFQNDSSNPQEAYILSTSSSATASTTYTSNLLLTSAGTVTPTGYDTSTGQSIKAFLWYCSTNTDTSSFTASQTKQLTNNFLRTFRVIRPFYKARSKFLDYIIIYAQQTGMYMRYPARKSGNTFLVGSTATTTYDFTQTTAYSNAKSKYNADSSVVLTVDLSSRYACSVIEIDIGCQNQFCGIACIFFLAPSSSTISNDVDTWNNLSSNLNKNIDKLFIFLQDSSIIFTSAVATGSSSADLLPFTTTISNTIQKHSDDIFFTSQTGSSWIVCGLLDLAYSTSSLGSLSTCSLSSKFSLKNILDSIVVPSFSPLYIYPLLIYFGMYITASIIIYQTSRSFMEPVKNISFKIFQITKGLFEIGPLSANRQIEEIRNLCSVLNELFDCIRFSDDSYYENLDDSELLIRLSGALEHFTKFKYERGIGIVCNNMGQVHIQNGRYKEAIKSYKQSLKIVEQKIKDLLSGATLEELYVVKPVNGWKYFLKNQYEEDEMDRNQAEINLDNISEIILKNSVFQAIQHQAIDSKKKDIPKSRGYQTNQLNSSSSLLASNSQQYQFQSLPSLQQQQQQQYINGMLSKTKNQQSFTFPQSQQNFSSLSSPQFFRQSLARSSLNNGLGASNELNTSNKPPGSSNNNQPKKKFIQMVNLVQNINQISLRSQKETPQAGTGTAAATTVQQDKKLIKIANAYYIYVFDMKKTNRKQAKTIAEKAIDKFLLVSSLLEKYKELPFNFRRHIMTLIRLNQLYLECADYNKYVAKNKVNQSQFDFKKSCDAYDKATNMLVSRQTKSDEEDKMDMIYQVHEFHQFLYLKGAGLYQDAVQFCFDSLPKNKYYDPALRFSYLTNMKQILDHFGINRIPRILNLIQGYNQRKSKDVVFVLDLTKTTKSNNTKKRCLKIFQKIYHKYIDEDDRVAFIRFDETVEVVFELKNIQNNAIYFKKFVDAEANPKGVPSLKLMCRAVAEGTKLFQKVENSLNSKWIFLITDNLRPGNLPYSTNSVRISQSGGNNGQQFQQNFINIQQVQQGVSNSQQSYSGNKHILQLRDYIEAQKINIMVIGIKLNEDMKKEYKYLCEATIESIFIEDGNNDNLDVVLESISNIQHRYGGAANSTGVPIQDFQKESFQNRKINDEIQSEDEEI